MKAEKGYYTLKIMLSKKSTSFISHRLILVIEGLIQTEVDKGDETWEVFNDESDGETTVENCSSCFCSSTLITYVVVVVSRFICLWKNFSMLFWAIFNLNVLSEYCFFAMIFYSIFTTIPIAIKICYVFFTWTHVQFLKLRRFDRIRSWIKE